MPALPPGVEVIDVLTEADIVDAPEAEEIFDVAAEAAAPPVEVEVPLASPGLSSKWREAGDAGARAPGRGVGGAADRRGGGAGVGRRGRAGVRADVCGARTAAPTAARRRGNPCGPRRCSAARRT